MVGAIEAAASGSCSSMVSLVRSSSIGSNTMRDAARAVRQQEGILDEEDSLARASRYERMAEAACSPDGGG